MTAILGAEFNCRIGLWPFGNALLRFSIAWLAIIGYENGLLQSSKKIQVDYHQLLLDRFF